MPETEADARRTDLAVRRAPPTRPAKPRVDAWRAHGTAIDLERRPNGVRERALTIFLAGAECPFDCVFCDLWRWAIDGPTPAGALPRQMADALASIHGARPDRIKLYNASNFFDARAVPVVDHAAIAALCTPFAGVTVESHASTIGPRVVDFTRRLDGRLEVAIGLESIHPTAIAKTGKRMTLDRFDRAAEFLLANGIDLRVFVLVGAPFVPHEASLEWAVRTVAHAASRGAALVSLIPVRGGNGELERLEAIGEFTRPALRDVEDTLDACVQVGGAVITADLWDVDRFSSCDACRAERVHRLARINETGQSEPRVACSTCGGE